MCIHHTSFQWPVSPIHAGSLQWLQRKVTSGSRALGWHQVQQSTTSSRAQASTYNYHRHQWCTTAWGLARVQRVPNMGFVDWAGLHGGHKPAQAASDPSRQTDWTRWHGAKTRTPQNGWVIVYTVRPLVSRSRASVHSEPSAAGLRATASSAAGRGYRAEPRRAGLRLRARSPLRRSRRGLGRARGHARRRGRPELTCTGIAPRTAPQSASPHRSSPSPPLTSFRRLGAPGRVSSAVSSQTTATSSTKTQSGRLSSAGSSSTCSPSLPRSTPTYSWYSLSARAKSTSGPATLRSACRHSDSGRARTTACVQRPKAARPPPSPAMLCGGDGGEGRERRTAGTAERDAGDARRGRRRGTRERRRGTRDAPPALAAHKAPPAARPRPIGSPPGTFPWAAAAAPPLAGGGNRAAPLAAPRAAPLTCTGGPGRPRVWPEGRRGGTAPFRWIRAGAQLCWQRSNPASRRTLTFVPAGVGRGKADDPRARGCLGLATCEPFTAAFSVPGGTAEDQAVHVADQGRISHDKGSSKYKSWGNKPSSPAMVFYRALTGRACPPAPTPSYC